ncbi:MAG: hypothetical protein LLG14_05375 [Nocardiaceae bacterium]|nr:hypothetical protein [Nocardiaceae bacterium]
MEVRNLPGIGDYLTDVSGYALYIFPPDDHHIVACTGECLGSWLPVLVHDGQLLGFVK